MTEWKCCDCVETVATHQGNVGKGDVLQLQPQRQTLSAAEESSLSLKTRRPSRRPSPLQQLWPSPTLPWTASHVRHGFASRHVPPRTSALRSTPLTVTDGTLT